MGASFSIKRSETTRSERSRSASGQTAPARHFRPETSRGDRPKPGKSKDDNVALSNEARSHSRDDDDGRVTGILGGLAESLGGAEGKPDTGKPGKPEPGKTEPSGEPDLSPENIEAVSEQANESNDPSTLDEIDSFRASLPPEQQALYDEQLQALREDERIRFVEHEGAEADLATRDLALRGILTSTFGNEDALERALNTAAHNGHNEDGDLVDKENGDGHLDIHLYPSEFPLDPLKDRDGEQITGGLVTSGGDIHASMDFFRNTLSNGENLFTHEFAHVVQGSTESGEWSDGNDFPQDFPEELREQFEQEFNSENFQDYFEEIGLNREYGGESYPGVQTVFRYSPQELKDASPELYDLMTRYHGYDPLAGETVESVAQLPDDESLFDRGREFVTGIIDGLNPFS